MKLKTEFVLTNGEYDEQGKMNIARPRRGKVFVSISIPGNSVLFVKDKDLERFAVNILKSLKSKRLKQPLKK